MRLLPLLVATVLTSYAETSSSQQEAHQSSPFIIRANSQLVQITVVATKAHNSPVKDLAVGDFSLREDGKPQKISTFIENGVDPGTVDTDIRTKPSFGRFTNSTEPNKQGSIDVLLLDQLDTPSKNWEQAWAAILRFVKSLRSSDRIAVYALDSVYGLRVIQDYNADSSDLLDRINVLREPTVSRPEIAPDTDRGGRFSHRPPDGIEMPELLSDGRLQGLSNALEAIANHMAGVPGRKSLIWFASYFPAPFSAAAIHEPLEMYRLRMLKAINNLIAADVAIYPVDARGLMPDHSFDAENEDIGIYPIEPGQLNNSLTVYNFSTLLELAHRSGGKAFFNTNGLTEAMQHVVLDTEMSYTLGFYTSKEPDNTFHRFSVTVTHPNVHLRYKPGFWHIANDRRSADSADIDLKTALESPFNAEAIRIQADAVSQAHSERVRLTLFIDPETLTPQTSADGHCRADLDLIVGQKEDTGRVFAIPPYRVSVVCDDALKAHKWLTTVFVVQMRSRSVALRAVVRDASSGLLGSIDIPVHGLDK